MDWDYQGTQVRDRCEANFVLPGKKNLNFLEGTGTNYNLSIDISYQYFVQQYKQCNSYKYNKYANSAIKYSNSGTVHFFQNDGQ